MARPLKSGVDYFPKDTSFYQDDKVRLIRANYGAKGLYLLDYLLCDLYGKNGYYMQWDNNKCLLVSDGAGCGCTPGFVAEAVAGFIRCSIFDKRVFDEFGILTSAGIQRRFVRMLESRKNFTFIEEYFLLDKSNEEDIPQGILSKCTFKKIIKEENPVINEENQVNRLDNSQNKIEENRINENRKEDAAVASVVKFYQDNMAIPITPMTMEKLADWLKDVDISLIEYAIEQAVNQNKRTWAYVEAILKNHFNAGRKTRAEAEGSKGKGSNAKPTSFSNFEGREFDYDAFESASMGKGDKSGS